ncbi:WecB/TagA/CpsF family glycosyltransferase [Clostridium tagluense]|uniref:WecB/TagA/CpsF family glycosyltransferase n=1 Tax=Clostridium tagluense TaxID=360422 RepID=UPI001CF41616|nr:WecB/TagA/CpsF family glycosyltransferase [Clostridium tagluense]MCB2312938.1 WecB/TagA/CpsF family glycosyltransferase [Clostridium tagluense]MCB2317704.1 WecB/TagA/CpsF family glycosyltransferase [Clostridium tagluense]MCB2322461.1 WecB/TagA/CpsF family glycosyltransferase [Clostridium tagluense]MCB2327464.1 WecB/TagA/CpsF family glycosyltransferase [Clostridium tagluense]MCB2332183.1 WecB/TagA/CpsF family glycosyltransferase [Clostridium tagluense]
MLDNVKILGVPFSKMNMKETVNIIANNIDCNNQSIFNIITGNPEIVLQAQKDSELQIIFNEADLITPDGEGIVLASKWKGQPLFERVTGVDLLLEVLKMGNERGWSFYFLGADEQVNKKATENILAEYPNIILSGRHHGYFDNVQEEKILVDIESKRPNILIVALGAPKAEKWIYNYKNRLPVKVAFGVGGSLDIISGKTARAPQKWQQLKLEWLYRLIIQPSRLRRQMVLPIFAYKSLMEALKEKRKRV